MKARAILAVCCVAQFVGLLDITIVNVALPSIRADLGFSTAGLQWVVNAYTLALAGFLLLGGRSADLIGRREVFAGGLALFGLASLAGGLAQDEATLVAARAAQGLGAAFVAPTGLSILATSFAEGAERNRAFGWWGTMGGLGGATGALAGGAAHRDAVVALDPARQRAGLPRRGARRAAGGSRAQACAWARSLVRPPRGAERHRGARARDVRDRQQRSRRAHRAWRRSRPAARCSARSW